MIRVKEGTLNGSAGFEISNQRSWLFIPGDFGPRITGWGLTAGENLLTVLPEAVIPLAGGEEFSLRGGHRLWVAPEQPESTYVPDDEAPQIREREEGLDVQQPPDRTGIQKEWEIRMHPRKAEVRILHRLINRGKLLREIAPWAVTMLRPGGVGLLPWRKDGDEGNELRPNRQLVVWPYTDINSPHLSWCNQGVFVTASLAEGALKIGSPNPSGWLAYRQNETLFVKRSCYQQGAIYTDQGASHQIYCDAGTIELETLGPLVSLEPGANVEHGETWQLFEAGCWPDEIRSIYSLGGF